MVRWTLAVPVLLTLLHAQGWAQTNTPPTPVEEKGTYLGALFGPVPDTRYGQLPALQRGLGVLITHVLPESPAHSAGLQRDDILLRYGTTEVHDCEQVARLIQRAKPGDRVKLTVLRDGKAAEVETILASGLPLRISSSARILPDGDVPRGTVKPGVAPALSITATPLTNGQLRVAIEYYDEGKYHTVTCAGTPARVQAQVEQLPERVQPLARKALEELAKLEILKAASSRPTPKR